MESQSHKIKPGANGDAQRVRDMPGVSGAIPRKLSVSGGKASKDLSNCNCVGIQPPGGFLADSRVGVSFPFQVPISIPCLSTLSLPKLATGHEKDT